MAITQPPEFATGLSNQGIVTAIQAARTREAKARDEQEQLLSLLERRANGDKTAWAHPAARYLPAKPEQASVAAYALKLLRAQ